MKAFARNLFAPPPENIPPTAPPGALPPTPSWVSLPPAAPAITDYQHANLSKPQLTLMGLSSCGKSSIINVVFNQLPPFETLFLTATSGIVKATTSLDTNFEVWDVSAAVSDCFLDSERHTLFGRPGSLIWVLDAQNESYEALHALHRTIISVRREFPFAMVDVFVHKVDSISAEYADEIRADIIRRTRDVLEDHGMADDGITYHMTSIYDYSAHLALSTIITRVMPNSGVIEQLLDLLVSQMGMHKALLFDPANKLFIGTDGSPVDFESFELSADFLSFGDGIMEIYGYDRCSAGATGATGSTNHATPARSSIVRIGNAVKGVSLYMKAVHRHLAVVCIMDRKSIKNLPAIDYNVDVFEEALKKLLEVGTKTES